MKRKSIYCLIAMAIIVLLLVHILFSISAPFPWAKAVWGAGDLITYIGTIALGIIAFVQNAKANEMNQRLMLLEESKYHLETRPFVFLSDWKVEILRGQLALSRSEAKETVCVDVGADLDDFKNEIICIEFLLTNTTHSCLSVQYHGIKYVGSDEDVGWKLGYTGLENFKMVLNPEQVGRFAFLGKRKLFEDTFAKGKVSLSFILENRFGERYQEDFDTTVIFRNTQSSNNSPLLLVDASNYKIGKFYYSGEKVELRWEENTDGQPQNVPTKPG